ncbi:MAG: hypothetical protein ACW98X_05395 [Promethearchaeota archaeon]|jgi:hypothetical protein
MAVLGQKDLIFDEELTYFQKFITKNGDEYGLRFGTPNDAKAISMIFKEIYEDEYIYPLVYDTNLLKRELADKNNYWFVGESLDNKEIAGTGLIKKNRYIAHAGQAVVKKKYQGLGVTTKIGAAGIITCTKMPQFNDTLRLDSEVRGSRRIQKLIKNAGALPYALIPAYLNYGDKRHFKVDDNNPFPARRQEAAFLYSIIFKKMWNIREKKIHLIDNEDFIFFHEFVKSYTKKMKNDELIFLKGKKDKGYELYGVSKDYYDGIVNLYNYIQEKSLENLIDTYRNWRIILWRIPTTPNGVNSMALALEKGFNIVGYDIGFNNMNWTLNDSIIMAYYPKGGSQVLKLEYLEENRPLFNKIREIFFSRID